MKKPKPNPEIYRLAAEIIHAKETAFTCYAIGMAGNRLFLSDASKDLHLAQYKAMFGSHLYAEKISRQEVCISDSHDHYCNHLHEYLNGSAKSRAPSICELNKAHPFWNKDFSKKRQKRRIMSLLLMADIVESPNPQVQKKVYKKV